MRRTSGRYRHWYTVDSRPGADRASVDDAVDRRQVGGERLLAHDVLAGRQGVDDDGLVGRGRRAHHDDVDVGALDELAVVVRRVGGPTRSHGTVGVSPCRSRRVVLGRRHKSAASGPSSLAPAVGRLHVIDVITPLRRRV